MFHIISEYKSFEDFINNNDVFISKFDYALLEYRFKTNEEVQESIEYKKKYNYKNIIYCHGKNVNYLIEHFDYFDKYEGKYGRKCNNCINVNYIYDKTYDDKLKNCFYFPENEDYELFDFVFDKYLIDFLKEKHMIQEYDWIKEKILNHSSFKPCKEKGKKHILEYCFVGSSDPYDWESYIGHRVVKKHGHILLKKYRKKSIYVEKDYVYMK